MRWRPRPARAVRKAAREHERERRAEAAVPRADSAFWHACALYAPVYAPVVLGIIARLALVSCGLLLGRCVNFLWNATVRPYL